MKMDKMPDREKVIARLEEAMLLSETANECKVTLGYGTVEDALALLKVQEPVSVQKKTMEMVGLQTWDWACGNCGQTVLFSAKFCPWCGRRVKWE